MLSQLTIMTLIGQFTSANKIIYGKIGLNWFQIQVNFCQKKQLSGTGVNSLDNYTVIAVMNTPSLEKVPNETVRGQVRIISLLLSRQLVRISTDSHLFHKTSVTK